MHAKSKIGLSLLALLILALPNGCKPGETKDTGGTASVSSNGVVVPGTKERPLTSAPPTVAKSAGAPTSVPSGRGTVATNRILVSGTNDIPFRP